MNERTALRALREYRGTLTRQELRTLAGQIKAGYAEDALRGLARIMARKAEARNV